MRSSKEKKDSHLWSFSGKEKGAFISSCPRKNLTAYFPLFNFAGLMSCTTPELKGDIKTGQNSFLTPPLVTEEIPHIRYSRNFWIKTDKMIWSATVCGFNTSENEKKDLEKSYLKAGILYYQLTRENKKLRLKVETTIFVPFTNDTVEISLFAVENTSKNKSISFTPFFAMPIYGRSADNQRDHRQVTTLLNRSSSDRYSVIVKPTMVFDEKGHHVNDLTYSISCCTGKGSSPDSILCLMEEYIGSFGTLDRPAWIFDDTCNNLSSHDGKEAVGAFRFPKITLSPGEKAYYIALAGISDSTAAKNRWLKKYGTLDSAKKALSETCQDWQRLLNKVDFETGDRLFDNWIKWVSLQPHARKVYGCSIRPNELGSNGCPPIAYLSMLYFNGHSLLISLSDSRSRPQSL